MKALKKVFVFILVVIFSVASGVIIFNSNFSFTSGGEADKPLIILDAGHGGLTNTID